MAFSVVSKSRVEGDKNLSIQLDRGRIRYSIEEKQLDIVIEQGVGEISVFGESIVEWSPPFSNVKIGYSEKQEIIDNVRKAMKLLGIGCVTE